MNILPKKSWHVRNKDNVARVRRDEAQAAEEEREAKRRVERAEQEARTEFLRRKARDALPSTEGGGNDDSDQQSGVLEHLNLFPLEEASEKKGNEDYLKEKKEEKEKQERAIGLLVSLGPQPGTEVTPWYLKTDKEKNKKEERGEKGKGVSEEEREKKDRRLKDSLDPLKDMKKALVINDRKQHKSKKKGEKSSYGESSMERLRAERHQREAEERRRAQALLDQRNNKRKDPSCELNDRERPYNTAYFPELARKRQRRDRDSWRDEILKS
ncbi:leukocyte receptor cluster member 1 [Gouania willdenowi]|uniref:CBF1-interacting co-repressor CIR N-terminal domain-containing protein n=1 Tax=Gouania willdenowi TaxID=441366 RepID=A0A8C5G016_GOUWI|nr:leukocyte receptor cluster member 1 [Gouania willdenowi]